MQPNLLILTLLSLLCSGVVLAAPTRRSAGPRRLMRCPIEFGAVVAPLPASPLQPVLTTGPGVRLQTVQFTRNSQLTLQPDGKLFFNASIELAGASDGRYSGPHVLLCTDANRTKLGTFSLYIRLVRNPVPTDESTAIDSTTPPGTVESVTGDALSPAEVTTNCNCSDAKTLAAAFPDCQTRSPYIAILAVATSVLLIVSVALAVALAIVCSKSKAAKSDKKRQIYARPPGGSCDPLFGQAKEHTLLSV